MNFFFYIETGYIILSCIIWILGFGFILRQLFAAPKINEVDAPSPEKFPLLSILVPACNEARTIEPALRSLLRQNYPNMEIIAINDRSTDETGDIIDRLSEEYNSLKTLHIDELPEGWIGKTHALKKGFSKATGEWILATDADVCYEPGALRSIMSVALHENLDQISCLPHMKNNGFLHEMSYNGFVTFVVCVQNLDGIQDVNSDDYFAFGAFNMVRRETFEKTKGFQWLRMEIADDMGTAKMMNDHKAKQGFYYAFEELTLEWYDSLKEMIRGLEKNGIAVLGHYSYLRGFCIPVVWLLLFLAPFIGLFSSWTTVQIIAASTVLLSIPFNITAARRLERPVSTFLFSFFGVCMMMFALIRSTYACAKRGGVEWRGTIYPVEKLRRLQRVKF